MEYTIFIIPLLLVFIGFLMFKKPPKKINWSIGYRTRKSMVNEKVWKFANQYTGKLWIKIGIIMFIISLFLFGLLYFKLILLTETFLSILILLQVGIIVLSIFIVECKIKNYK